MLLLLYWVALAAGWKIHSASTVRTMTCDGLSRDEAAFVRIWDGEHPSSPAVKVSWAEYVKDMRKKDIWASELEAVALARTVDCTIYIVHHLYCEAWPIKSPVWEGFQI